MVAGSEETITKNTNKKVPKIYPLKASRTFEYESAGKGRIHGAPLIYDPFTQKAK